MADSQVILDLLFLHIQGVFTYTSITFPPYAHRDMLFFLSASLCIVHPTYQASHWHENS